MGDLLMYYMYIELEWTDHVNHLTIRVNKIINGLRIIRRKFNQKHLSQIVTSQVFGVQLLGSSCLAYTYI